VKKNAFFFNVKMESSTLTAALSRTDILSRELIMTYYVVEICVQQRAVSLKKYRVSYVA
jgi:hypothetical protein